VTLRCPRSLQRDILTAYSVPTTTRTDAPGRKPGLAPMWCVVARVGAFWKTSMAIIVEFVGGFRDGFRASMESKDPEESGVAQMAYHLSHRGEIGRKHKTASDAARHILETEGAAALAQRGLDMNHFYKVVSNDVVGDDTIIRFQAVGPDD
jgi:hypothetical protein